MDMKRYGVETLTRRLKLATTGPNQYKVGSKVENSGIHHHTVVSNQEVNISL